MLDHDHRVAQVAQVDERLDELVVVPLVQADARFVEDVEHPGQARADLRGQADALGLAAGERPGLAVERQVAQAHAVEKEQPLADLLEDRPGDGRLPVVELEGFEFADQLFDGHAGDVGDRPAAHAHGQGLGLEPGAVAGRAVLFVHELLDLLAQSGRGGFPEQTVQSRHDALEGELRHHPPPAAAVDELELLPAGAVQEGLLHPGGQVGEGRGQVKLVVAGKGLDPLAAHGGQSPPRPRGDGALDERQRRVRDDALLVDELVEAQAGTGRTGAEGVVEGEQLRRQFRHRDGAPVAGGALAIQHLLAAVREQGDHDPVAQGHGGAHRLVEAPADGGFQHQPVDDRLDLVEFVLVEDDLLAQLADLAVHAHAHEPLFAQPLQHLLVLALLAGDERRQQDDLLPLRPGEQGVEHVVDRLGADRVAALGTVGLAGAAEQQAQVVVDLGDRAHGGARVPAGGFLLDGDRGGQPLEQVHVRLVHLAEELAGIGGQRFHVAALSLGVEGVKGQGGLARAGQPGENDEFVAGQVNRDVLQVVHARAPDAQKLRLHGCGGRFPWQRGWFGAAGTAAGQR